MGRTLLVVRVLVLAVVAALFFTGSLAWRALGSGDRLVIEGRAEVVAAADSASSAGWSAYGGDAGGSRYSAASEITPHTVSRLEVAWQFDTGKGLWKTRLPATSAATPMTYMWQGRQYVVVAAGGYGNMPTRMGDHVVAFALPAAP